MSWTRIAAPQLEQEAAARAAAYASAEPFPHVILDDFFTTERLAQVADEFPDLSQRPAKGQTVKRYEDAQQRKFASSGEQQFGEHTRAFMHFLNSLPFLQFLSTLTGVDALISDPYFEGGGLHEIRREGFLKVHADFNKHRTTGLDRRLNVLVYLNRNWEDGWGGHLELWDRGMTRAVVKVAPRFNRTVVFTTDDTSYHGHPDPLNCPPDRSRRSLALYYYTNGRPGTVPGTVKRHTTLFQPRPGTEDAAQAARDARLRPLRNVMRSVRSLLER